MDGFLLDETFYHYSINISACQVVSLLRRIDANEIQVVYYIVVVYAQ